MKPGRPKLLQDPTPMLVRVERRERDALSLLAALNGWSLNRELQLAVRKHLRTSLDDRGDDVVLASRTTNAPSGTTGRSQ